MGICMHGYCRYHLACSPITKSVCSSTKYVLFGVDCKCCSMSQMLKVAGDHKDLFLALKSWISPSHLFT